VSNRVSIPQPDVSHASPKQSQGFGVEADALYTGEAMSVREEPQDSSFTVVTPAEALMRARPLPLPQDLVIEDVSDVQWQAFWEALAD
jgi:hypothetical protein